MDKPFNGGSYVKENGYGYEEYNFLPVKKDDGQCYCLGYVETKTTSANRQNALHIEKIQGCELLKGQDFADDILVVWCATTDINDTSIVGWYKHATVFRYYESMMFENEYEQPYNIIAKKEDCVLLPYQVRHKHKWDAPTAKRKKYGFGQSMIWYASEKAAEDYIQSLFDQIETYQEENSIDKFAYNASEIIRKKR